MGIHVRLCSDQCLREADGESDYPQTAVSCIVRTQYPYFAQRYAGITGFGPLLRLLLNWHFYLFSSFASTFAAFVSFLVVFLLFLKPCRLKIFRKTTITIKIRTASTRRIGRLDMNHTTKSTEEIGRAHV